MRTKSLIGRKARFGPRRLGWGWFPVTAEGWAVLAVGVGGAIVLAFTVSFVAVAVMLVIIFLKGSSPGGPDEWHEFQAVQDINHDS